MLIEYKSRKIMAVCTDACEAEKNHGKAMAEKIQLRVDQLVAATSVEEMIRFKIGRCHQLTGDRKKQYAVDLIHPYRLVFEKKGNEIQIAHIFGIVDYH